MGDDVLTAISADGSAREVPATGAAYVSDILVRPEDDGVAVYRFRGVWWRTRVESPDDPTLASMLRDIPEAQRRTVLRLLGGLLRKADPLAGDEALRRRLEFLVWLRRHGKLDEWASAS